MAALIMFEPKWLVRGAGTPDNLSYARELVCVAHVKRPSHGKLKLANTCLHTSNSRQITTHAKFVSPLVLPFFCLFFVFVCCRRNVPHIRTIFNFLDELKSCLTIVFTSVRHFVKCHANHVNRARFDWLTATNTRLPIVHTSNTSLPTRKSWRE